MNFNNVIEFYKAFNQPNDINCYSVIIAGKKGQEKYWQWINNYENNLFYLVNDDNPNYILGTATIEDSPILNWHLDYLNIGAIGYEIRPNERRKRYGTHLLTLLLKKCEELGKHEVCISCLENNIASKKIIEHNLGKFEKRFFDDNSGKYGLKYWIKLHPPIKYRAKRLFKQIKNAYTNFGE